jgi:hypothetical protein
MSMFPIATYTVTAAGGDSAITFNSILQSFTHLQIRVNGRTTGTNSSGNTGNYFNIVFNGVTGTSYSYQAVYGDGVTAQSAGLNNQPAMYGQRLANGNTSSSTFGGVIIDVLDYSNTSKTKTIRNVGGFDNNGGGAIFLASGGFYSTNAITSVTFSSESGNFAQNTRIDLYGIATSFATGV